MLMNLRICENFLFSPRESSSNGSPTKHNIDFSTNINSILILLFDDNLLRVHFVESLLGDIRYAFLLAMHK
jgi:hypothetical protein